MLINDPTAVDRRPGLGLQTRPNKSIHYRGPANVSFPKPLESAESSTGGAGKLQLGDRVRRSQRRQQPPNRPSKLANRARNAPALRQAPLPLPLTAERLPSHDTRTGRGTQTRGDGRDAHWRREEGSGGGGGKGAWHAQLTARRGRSLLPRNILEVIGVGPDGPQYLFTESVGKAGRAAKFERSKKEKAGPKTDREPL